jgi:hypothetical protein
LKNRGKPCIFVGYSVNHTSVVYRMLNLSTKSIIQSCEIIWLNEAYHDLIERKVSQNKENDDVISNSKIHENNVIQDKLRSAQDQDELKEKNVIGQCIC